MPDERLPRPLTDRESAAIRFLLSPDDDRLEPLRAQVNAANVQERWPCCPSIDLVVDRTRLRPAVGLDNLAAQAMTSVAVRDEHPFDLILFIDDGWLTVLELVHYVDPAPDELPALALFDEPWASAGLNRYSAS